MMKHLPFLLAGVFIAITLTRIIVRSSGGGRYAEPFSLVAVR